MARLNPNFKVLLRFVFSGINHNIDELLVGVLSQVKLRRERRKGEKTPKKVNIGTNHFRCSIVLNMVSNDSNLF